MDQNTIVPCRKVCRECKAGKKPKDISSGMREEGRRQDSKIMHENKPSSEGEGRPVGYGRSEKIGEGMQPSGIYHLRVVKKIGMEGGQKSKLKNKIVSTN